MAQHYLQTLIGPGAEALQTEAGSRESYARMISGGNGLPDALGDREAEFIAARDSFYMASVTKDGWPYVQHRGGPAGFVKLIDDKTLAFPDFRGNRQYISLGNTNANDRVALIMMDYPHRRRLKLYAHVEVRELADDPDLVEKLILPGYRAVPERAFLLHLDAFDWNCPQHITPRFTESEIAAAVAPLQARLNELEAQNHALREKLAARKDPA